MKIVIDIPDKKWELIQNNQYCGIIDDLLYQNIKNSTPLEEVFEDIKAEIKAEYKKYLEMNDIDWMNGVDYALSIIDNHIAERSDK